MTVQCPLYYIVDRTKKSKIIQIKGTIFGIHSFKLKSNTLIIKEELSQVQILSSRQDKARSLRRKFTFLSRL